MAKRLTNRKKKLIIADYTEMGSYAAVARKHQVSRATVRRVMETCPDVAEIATEKKMQNTSDMLSFMDSRKDKAQSFIDLCLDTIADSDKIKLAQLQQITTAMGTVIDKFTNLDKMDENMLEKARKLLDGVDSAL